MTEYDAVHRPSHYALGRDFEPIDVIEDWGLGFHLANAMKYISRAGRKGDEVEDLEKAVWYLRRRIDQLENKVDIKAAAEARKEPRITGISWTGETAGYMDLMGDADE